MAVTPEPVKVFTSYRSSVIASVSQHLHPESPRETPASSHVETELLFETKYGLRLELYRRCNSYLIEICNSSPKTKPRPNRSENTTIERTSPSIPKSVGPKNADHTRRRYRYRIFPDWQTSFLWHDPEWLKDPGDDCEVEDETIESLYPALAPFFFAWREVHETEFEKQECHLGGDAEVFPDVRARVAWETEGFLMSCWLARQNEVESVEYSPDSKTYRVEKDTMCLELQKFLGDMESLLEM